MPASRSPNLKKHGNFQTHFQLQIAIKSLLQDGTWGSPGGIQFRMKPALHPQPASARKCTVGARFSGMPLDPGLTSSGKRCLRVGSDHGLGLEATSWTWFKTDQKRYPTCENQGLFANKKKGVEPKSTTHTTRHSPSRL